MRRVNISKHLNDYGSAAIFGPKRETIVSFFGSGINLEGVVLHSTNAQDLGVGSDFSASITISRIIYQKNFFLMNFYNASSI